MFILIRKIFYLSFFITIPVLLLLWSIKPVSAITIDYSEHQIPPEVISAFERAIIKVEELPAGTYYTYGDGETDFNPYTYKGGYLYEGSWSGPCEFYGVGGRIFTFRVIIGEPYEEKAGYIILTYLGDKEMRERLDYIDNFLSKYDYTNYPGLPNAIYSKHESEIFGEFINHSNTIDFAKGDWVLADISFPFEFAEVERLTHLLWTRLPDQDPSGPIIDTPLTPTPDPGTEDGGFPPSNIDSPTGLDYTGDDYTDSVPPTISTDRIPDGALPLAAGASALIAALGALGVALANGIPPHEAIRELLELLRGRQNPQTGGRAAEDILANPSLQDRVTDANGKKWVFYKTPGDESSGNHWISASDYDYYMKMERQGKTFSQNYGWTDAKQRTEYEKNQEIHDRGDRKDRERLRENIHSDWEENNRRMQAEIDRRNAIENKRLELEELELQGELDKKAIDKTYIDGLRGTSREIFTGVGKKWDPESGQYVDSLSWSSLGLRMVTGVASGGTSELYYRSAYGAYGVHDRLERGETLFHAVMGTANDLSKEALIGKGIQKMNPLVSWGANKTANYIPDNIKSAAGKVSYELNKPRSLPFGKVTPQGVGAIKPTPLPSDMLAKKNAISDALKIKDPVKQAEAIRDLYKNGGMKDMHALEKSGHLTAEQANRINQTITKDVNSAIQEATNKSMKDFRVATKNGIEARVDGVKVNKVMLGDSGSSSGKNIVSKGRSISTDNDRTIHAVFDKQQLSNYAKKNNIPMGEAQKRLNDKFVVNHNRYLDETLRNRNLTASDVDYKGYSGMGSNAGPADSYPEGFTRVRQAVQGKTEIYSVNSKGQVNSYNTSGRALTDQTALEKLQQTGDRSIIESGGAKIIGRASEGKMLISEQIPNLESGSLNKIAKGLERANKGLALIDSTTKVPNDIMALANYVRNNPQGVHLLTPDQQQQLLDYATELAKQLK